MTRLLGFLGLLLLIGSCLLVAQSAEDPFWGETLVRTDRVSPPRTVARAAELEEFRRTMAGHWLASLLPALRRTGVTGRGVRVCGPAARMSRSTMKVA